MPECAQTFWICLASSLLPFPALPIETRKEPGDSPVIESGIYSFELSHLGQHTLSIIGSCMNFKI